eukprot:TRINITY_DN17840_c1_g2_i3.p1 TRINITY_DN17840_c1_g2~~TRINITY_DN17840_c1_g2_i3.p1  ORF type:complete len:434 (+),score=84.49 TRINITY_DN17840_c1_g2_i3:493-1794(+)
MIQFRSQFLRLCRFFKIGFFHLGGDEVNFDCWRSNAEIVKWMDEMNIPSFEQLQGLYVGMLLKKLRTRVNQNRYVVWQEVFDNGVSVPNGSVIQVWKWWMQDQNVDYANLRSMQILGRPLSEFQYELENYLEEDKRLKELQAQGVQFSVKVIEDESSKSLNNNFAKILQDQQQTPALSKSVVLELDDKTIVEQQQRSHKTAEEVKKQDDKIQDEAQVHGQQEVIPQHINQFSNQKKQDTDELHQPKPLTVPNFQRQLLDTTNTDNEHFDAAVGKVPDSKIQQSYEIHKPDARMTEVQRRLSTAPYLLELEVIVKKGLHALLSAPWYLDLIEYGEQWKKYYVVDPQDIDATIAQKKLILGGETCLWGEYVDVTNFLSRAWPRASAVAERLWSSAKVRDVDAAGERLIEHVCRMRARGFPVEPVRPGFCPLDVTE